MRWFVAMVAAVLVTTSAMAADVGITFEAPVLSDYVWRGIVVNEAMVVQPALTVVNGGMGLGYWGNINADGSDGFTEHDLTASYGAAVGKLQYGVGIVDYSFPDSASESTREVFASVGGDVVAAPTVTAYYDVDEVDSLYVSLGVGHTIGISDQLAIELAGSLGYALDDYVAYYYGPDESVFTDGSVAVTLPYLVKDLTITPGVQYVWLVDQDLTNTLAEDDHFVYSLNTAWSF